MDKSDILREKYHRRREAEARAEEHGPERMREYHGRLLKSTEFGSLRNAFLDQPLVADETARFEVGETEKEFCKLTAEELIRGVRGLTDKVKGWQDPEEYLWQHLPEVRFALTGAIPLTATCLLIALLYGAGFSLEAATDGVGLAFAWTAALVCTLAAGAGGGAVGYGIGQAVRECADPDKQDLWPLFPMAGALLPGFFVWPRVFRFVSTPPSRSLYYLADAAWAGMIFLIVLIITMSLDLSRRLFHLACRHHRGLRILAEDQYAEMLQGQEGQDLMTLAGACGRILSAASYNSWKASWHYGEYKAYEGVIKVLDEEIQEILRMQRP